MPVAAITHSFETLLGKDRIQLQEVSQSAPLVWERNPGQLLRSWGQAPVPVSVSQGPPTMSAATKTRGKFARLDTSTITGSRTLQRRMAAAVEGVLPRMFPSQKRAVNSPRTLPSLSRF